MSPKVVVTDHVYRDLEIEERILRAAGADVVSLAATTADEVVDRAADADALVTTNVPVTAAVFANLPDLSVVVRYGAGYETVDVDAATEYGVPVVTVPDYCVDEVATHAVGLLLACERRIVQYDRHVRDGGWDWRHRAEHTRLRGKTLGIVGFGNVGRRVAEMVAGFGVDVIAYSRSSDQSELDAHGVEGVSFDDLLARSDLVTIHAALTDRTAGLFDAAAFAAMKDTAVLCNTARGGIVDQDALLDALDADEIALAGLDVLAEEPPAPDDPIRRHDDVVVTPHVAWYSETATEALRRRVADETVRALRGETPEHVVNPGALE